MRIRLLSFPDPILNNNNNILSGSYRVAYHRQCLSALCNKDQHHDKVVANTDQFSTVNPTSVQRMDISLILCDTFGPLSGTTNYEVTHYTAQLGRWGGSPVWLARAPMDHGPWTMHTAMKLATRNNKIREASMLHA